ncbi:YfgM family protein [Agrilutibacter solisilvae]|uniref:Ancillary SecYEG translocon subunit n=1 Tax=Agrilutibacter solisilvae TaxID=2763317 RepID=A0A975AS91_9GAMM|nr:tetratricopeptide repeat protein [Lysobacter solisilvae]QSX77725.1 tetratricopeptide repeat protein [Lysobacter solisilvae]
MAIDELLDEHEQSERVREWLRRNGSALTIGIALGLAAIGGWQWWKVHRQNQLTGAADAYQSAVTAIEGKDAAASAKVNATPDGIYRALAQLELAKSQYAAGKRDDAIATLRAVKTSDPALAPVVQVRLARLLIDAKKADEALKLVASADSIAAMEVRGDAQLALGKRDQARETYGKALLRTEVGTPQRRLLELKLTEAGGTPPKTETQS